MAAVGVLPHFRDLGHGAFAETVLEGLYPAPVHVRKVRDIDDVLDHVAGLGADAGAVSPPSRPNPNLPTRLLSGR